MEKMKLSVDKVKEEISDRWGPYACRTASPEESERFPILNASWRKP
jgi:hypothetical protein